MNVYLVNKENDMNFKWDLKKQLDEKRKADSAKVQLRERSKQSIARPKAEKNISCNHKCHCNVDKCPRCICSRCIHLEEYEEALTLTDEYIPWWKKILNLFKI